MTYIAPTDKFCLGQVTEPTNTTRATRARKTLEYYVGLYGERVDESTMTDLLADLMHLYDCPTVFKAFEMAEGNYLEECAEEEK
jgi:hypothetical protein